MFPKMDFRHVPKYLNYNDNPHDRRMHHVIVGLMFTNQFPQRSPWYEVILRSMRNYLEYRVSVPSETPAADALAYVQQHGGSYYEGLVTLPRRCPEPAVWCIDGEHLRCYSHDLSGPHAIQGFQVSSKNLKHLTDDLGIKGPYLFHRNPQVFRLAVPHSIQKHVARGIGRLQ